MGKAVKEMFHHQKSGKKLKSDGKKTLAGGRSMTKGKVGFLRKRDGDPRKWFLTV